MEKRLLCGAAVRDITPPEELLHGLRGLMGTKFGGVHDPLKVRAAAFFNGEERAVIIQADTDKDQSPERVLKSLAERWGIRPENVMYFGTHTHAAPMHTGRPELERWLSEDEAEEVRRCTKAYEEIFFAGLFGAVEEALGTMRPCRIGCGSAQEYSNVRRVQNFDFYTPEGRLGLRRVTEGADPGAEIGRTMFVMRVSALSGEPIAFLVNYPMHCVVMFQNGLAGEGKSLVSGDVAGTLSGMLERRFPGAPALWSSGAAGDVNPLPNSFMSYVDPDSGVLKQFRTENPQDLMEYLAARQFAAVMAALGSIDYESGRADIRGAAGVSRTPQHPRRADGSADRNSLARDTFDIRLQALRIGDVLLLGIGGELFNSIGRELLETSPLKNTAVINHDLSLLHPCGYIYDDDAIARGYVLGPGMETRTAAGYISPSLRALLCRMLEEL